MGHKYCFKGTFLLIIGILDTHPGCLIRSFSAVGVTKSESTNSNSQKTHSLWSSRNACRTCGAKAQTGPNRAHMRHQQPVRSASYLFLRARSINVWMCQLGLSRLNSHGLRRSRTGGTSWPKVAIKQCVLI